MFPSCFSTWILSFSVCCQNSKEPAGMGLVAIRDQGCNELWPGFAWKPDQHFPVSELQVASTLTCIKPCCWLLMRFLLLGFDCLLRDDGYTRCEIDLGPPLRNHCEAAADAKRLN